MLPARLSRLALRQARLRRTLTRAHVLSAFSSPTLDQTPRLAPRRLYSAKDSAKPPPHHPSPPPSASGPPEGPVDDPHRKLHLIYTCGVCETRSTKSFSKAAYERGVVIVRCPGCDSQHLIADNLGWFGEERNVEQILAKKGVPTARITDDDFEHVP